MNKVRMLAFSQSKKLSAEDLEDVAAAGMTTRVSGGATYGYPNGWDAPNIDVSID